MLTSRQEQALVQIESKIYNCYVVRVNRVYLVCLPPPSVNLSTDSANKLAIYQEFFEKRYVDEMGEYYSAHATQHLAENGVQNYMRYVRDKLARVELLRLSVYESVQEGTVEDGSH